VTLSEAASRALEALPAGLEPLAVAARLRKVLPPVEARDAAELYALRRRARHKLPGAERLFLTRKALEQATDLRIARLRAARIAERLGAEAPGVWVLDATAGIGGDALALAQAGLERLLCADADAGTAHRLRANLDTLPGGERAAVLCRRAETWSGWRDLLVLDPDRRTDRSRTDGRGGPGRSGDPERWSPSWSAVVRLVAEARGACVKLAPAVDVERLAPDLPAELAHSWQWVSLRGELKEAALWTGVLAARGAAREVLAIGGDGTVTELAGEPRRVVALGREEALAVRWIADPDPALVRSGLLGTLAQAEGLRPLASSLAYLGGDVAPTSPLLKPLEVLGQTPLDRRRVRRLLAEHDVGEVTVKKRGHPEDAATLARRMRGRGRRRGVLVVARLDAGHHAYLVRPPSGDRPAARSE
jgi:hypothetical protein